MRKTLNIFQAYPSVLLTMALAAGSLIIYGQTGLHEFLLYDDDLYITTNSSVITGLTWQNIKWAFTTFHASNWHPITWISHMVDCQVWGLSSGFHHLTNLLFHIANTLLLFALLLKNSRRFWCAGIVAALFAFHPLHVESVAWVAERKDVLSLFWGLLAILCYSSYTRERKPLYYLLSLLLFGLGLMSKPMLISLPVILLLFDYWPLKVLNKTKSFSTLTLEKTPFFIFSVLSGTLTFLAQQHGESIVSVTQHPLSIRFSNAVVSVSSYIVQTFWPLNLSVFYPHPESISPLMILSSLVFLISITFLFLKRRKKQPYLLMGWAWFIVSLVPVLGLIQVGEQAHADRYMYLPSIGLFIVIVWSTGDIANTFKKAMPPTTVLTIFSLGICMFLSWKQTQYWQNQTTLFSHALSVTENNFVAHLHLGNALAKDGDFGKAESQLKASIAIKETSKAYNNLGYVVEQQGFPEKAKEYYRQAITLSPSSSEAQFNLGLVLLKEWKAAEAIPYFLRTLEIKANHIKAKENLLRAQNIVRAKRVNHK